jgi:archaemetzincin
VVRIVRVGNHVPLELLDKLAAGLAPVLHSSCRVDAEIHDPTTAFDPGRGQYFATRILARLTDQGARVLGVTSFDLFVPVLTFVFGEAQLGGNRALVSFHRLREDFYGLPPNPDLLSARLLKEALHELGHTFGLRHCPEWSCVMSSSHAVERLDVKSAEYCAQCRLAVDARRE